MPEALYYKGFLAIRDVPAFPENPVDIVLLLTQCLPGG
jgi:hypothetical protein